MPLHFTSVEALNDIPAKYPAILGSRVITRVAPILA
jgi:hypothetical protein